MGVVNELDGIEGGRAPSALTAQEAEQQLEDLLRLHPVAGALDEMAADQLRARVVLLGAAFGQFVDRRRRGWQQGPRKSFPLWSWLGCPPRPGECATPILRKVGQF
jgi:hypothetical protein